MGPTDWPSLREWKVLYLRLLIHHAGSLKQAARTAGFSEDTLKAKRTEAGVQWVKPLQKRDDMLAMPDFMVQFMETVKRITPPPVQPPSSEQRPPEPSS